MKKTAKDRHIGEQFKLSAERQQVLPLIRVKYQATIKITLLNSKQISSSTPKTCAKVF